MSLDPEVRRGGNLPFGMFASVWMCDPRYSTNARTLYAILVTYADTHSRDTGRGKPYRVELARQLGTSLATLDRTLDELEAAGLVVVEARVDPENPKKNDANIYHLKDFPLMYAGNGEWTDPLPAGVKAADVAKEQTEARRAAKREQGIQRRGGVPKGVNPRAVREGRGGCQGPHGPRKNAPVSGGGGSTHAARGSSMGAARVAAPMLPNVYSPLQNPSPEPDPSVRPLVPEGGARANETDGRTGGGGGKKGKRGRREPAAPVAPVVDNEGVALLLAIGAEQPEFLLSDLPLAHQGLKVMGMLADGWTPELIRQVVAGRPLPERIETTVAGVISGRLSKASKGPVPRAGMAPAAAEDGSGYGCDVEERTPGPAPWSVVRERITSGSGRLRDCAGDEGLCPRVAEPGREMCADCLGWVVCECGVRRFDPAVGAVCGGCAEEAADVRRALVAAGFTP